MVRISLIPTPNCTKEYLKATFVSGGFKTENQNLVILWRQDVTRGAYEWMEWDGSNTSSQKLESTLSKLLNEKKPLAHLIELKVKSSSHDFKSYNKETNLLISNFPP